jgi:hypothetical protein
MELKAAKQSSAQQAKAQQNNNSVLIAGVGAVVGVVAMVAVASRRAVAPAAKDVLELQEMSVPATPGGNFL